MTDQEIQKHLRHIKRRDPLYPLVSSFLYGNTDNTLPGMRSVATETRPPLTDAEADILSHILRETHYSTWRRSLLATWVLAQVPLHGKLKADAVYWMCDFLRKPETLSKKVARSTGRFGKGLIKVSLAGGLLFYILNDAKDPGDIWLFAFALFFLLGAVGYPIFLTGFMIQRSNRDTQIRRAFLYALKHLHEPATIGTIAFAATHPYQNVRDAAKQALLVVLPTLTPEHYGRLDSDTIPNLCRILDGDTYPVASEALILAILNALEKIGDGRTVSSVQRIADASFPTCQRVALRILPMLMERRERERQSGMLLRASSAPATTPAELLRPAAAASASTESTQLLRATAGSTQQEPQGRE